MNTKHCASSIINDWEDVRWNTIEFVKALGDKGLKKKLPRPGLDTYCKHFQEMIDVQKAYTNAIRSGKMDFSNVLGNDDYSGNETAKNLLKMMKVADKDLRQAVESAPEGKIVEWPEVGNKSVSSLLINLYTHEIFHVGQLIAFCYVTKVSLPQSLIDAWFLSPKNM